jgi:hypothetical protein
MPPEQPTTTEAPTVWPPPPLRPDEPEDYFTVEGTECQRDPGRLTLKYSKLRKQWVAAFWAMILAAAFYAAIVVIMILESMKYGPGLLDAVLIMAAQFSGCLAMFWYTRLSSRVGCLRILNRREDAVMADSNRRLCALSEIERVHIHHGRMLRSGYFYVFLQRSRTGPPYAFRDRILFQQAGMYSSRYSDLLIMAVGIDDAERIAQTVSDFADIPITRSWIRSDAAAAI